jgi:hypothetical protein
MPEAPMRALRQITPIDATDEELARLKGMTDDELLRAATSLDLFSIAESNRRLKQTLHKEEQAIKRLTGVLVFLTLVLVVLTLILVSLGIEALRH